jgi:hypothetical protein
MKVLKQFFWFLMLLAMFAAAAAGGYAVYLERQDRAEIDKLRAEVAGFDPRFEKFKGAVGELSKGFTSLVLEEADLTRAGWQPIGKGFYLVDVTTAPLDKGVRIRGKIINATAVLHEGLTFMFRIGKTSSTIIFPRAAPAVALPFEVTMPDVAPADAKKAFIELVSSTISFSATTTGKSSGRDGFDPDKILHGAN